MSLRHKKRHPEKVSHTVSRKVLANRARRNGYLQSGQSATPFSLDDLKMMANG